MSKSAFDNLREVRKSISQGKKTSGIINAKMKLNSRRKKFGLVCGVVILFLTIFLPVYFLVISDNNDDNINHGELWIFKNSQP